MARLLHEEGHSRVWKRGMQNNGHCRMGEWTDIKRGTNDMNWKVIVNRGNESISASIQGEWMSMLKSQYQLGMKKYAKKSLLMGNERMSTCIQGNGWVFFMLFFFF